MHILNIMQCTNLGGTEHASLRMMQGLQERGHTFEVVSVNPLGSFAAKLAQSRIPAVGVPFDGKLGWRTHLRLRHVLRSIEADAVLMTGPTLTGILAVGARPSEKRVLAVHFHHEGVKRRWAWRALYRLVLSRFDAVTFPSQFVRHEAIGILPDLERISHTVYSPLPLPSLPSARERADARKRLGLPADRPVIGNAGWLIPRKRFDVFLQVARQVIDRLPDTLMLVVGDGILRTQLERMAADLRISDHVIWLGWRQDLESVYHSLDVLLFNSDWDAMGLTPLEAAAFGVPVVASVLHGGLSEILGEGGAFLLAARHDVDQLANACIGLLEDSEMARQQGMEGRMRVAARCSTGEAVHRLECLLAGGGAC